MRYLTSSILIILLLAGSAFAAAPEYDRAAELGRVAAAEAAGMIGKDWPGREAIVITNAGYASPQGLSTQGCLDGIPSAAGVSVGASTLLAVQTRFDQPLWFAFFDKGTGLCAYLETTNDVVADYLQKQSSKGALFQTAQKARIDADHLFAEPGEFITRAKAGLFGNNLFRIVTISNAVARGCPESALKAMQVHDHYCPGVTSGVMMVEYIRRHILVDMPTVPCFILSLQPWCKEDALVTLLNATPGKRSYGVFYPTDKDIENAGPLANVCTAVFYRNGKNPWKGELLAFDFAKAKKQYSDKQFGYPVLDKLYADLWFLDRLDTPEEFVSVVKKVEMKEGADPKNLLRPGADPFKMLSEM